MVRRAEELERCPDCGAALEDGLCVEIIRAARAVDALNPPWLDSLLVSGIAFAGHSGTYTLERRPEPW